MHRRIWRWASCTILLALQVTAQHDAQRTSTRGALPAPDTDTNPPPLAPFGYVYPRPYSDTISPLASIIIRPPAAEIRGAQKIINAIKRAGKHVARKIRVEGSESGRHKGVAHVSNDAMTVVFKPHRPFALGENVTVTIEPGMTYTKMAIPHQPDTAEDTADDEEPSPTDVELLAHATELGEQSLTLGGYQWAFTIADGVHFDSQQRVFRLARPPMAGKELSNGEHDGSNWNDTRIIQAATDPVFGALFDDDETFAEMLKTFNNNETDNPLIDDTVLDDDEDEDEDKDEVIDEDKDEDIVDDIAADDDPHLHDWEKDLSEPTESDTDDWHVLHPSLADEYETLGKKGEMRKKRGPTVSYATLEEDFPHINVKKGSGKTADGLIFTEYLRHPAESVHNYILIVTDGGDVVWYERCDSSNRFWNGWTVRDFKMHENGELTYHDRWLNGWIHLNSKYQKIGNGIIRPKMGYSSDGHCITIRKDGHRLMLLNDFRVKDMEPQYGGWRKAQVHGFAVQEQDVNGHVTFQWSSWDHMPKQFSESVRNIKDALVDHLHPNSVTYTPGGDILVSMRHMNQIIEISRHDGHINWRFGGNGGDFKIAPQHRFSHQHDAVLRKGGKLSFFDNGTLLHRDPLYSAGRQFRIDPKAKSAKQTWAVKGPFGNAMGGMQNLPGGRKAITWAGVESENSNPLYTEFSHEKEKLVELTFANDGNLVFKSKKFDGWKGTGVRRPKLIVRKEDHHWVMHYSWNGATNIHKWEVYAGKAGPKHLVHTHKHQRFESFLIIPKNAAWRPKKRKCVKLKVVPIDKDGNALTASDTVEKGPCGDNDKKEQQQDEPSFESKGGGDDDERKKRRKREKRKKKKRREKKTRSDDG
ncbi:unnamed protein product [Vitrella brassicaformis CCMP3155]|uniref:Uncharacterized protein n=1 Tax=Vitrella brassicaformis (strain CCMP3155) TaxID=1169540 RepID=A0A0G4GIF9_VITBC|nr:unnamed protein product [Vitrella brassicaformis CCMP3155]|eukprot:CEM29634.1 unnamed protein product [Vitrella brassicaformis CCMP3155]